MSLLMFLIHYLKDLFMYKCYKNDNKIPANAGRQKVKILNLFVIIMADEELLGH